MHVSGDAGALPVMAVIVYSTSAVGTAPTGTVTMHDDGYLQDSTTCVKGATGCNAHAVWISVNHNIATDAESGADPTTTRTILDATATAAIQHTATASVADKKYNGKHKHISAQFGLGAVTLGLGYTEFESNDPKKTADEKTTYLGAGGSIGDTGLSWGAWIREKKDHGGKETSPWGLSLTKGLGDGARTFIEHHNADDDESGVTLVGLRADF